MVSASNALGEPRQIGFDAVEPERIGIDQKERRVAQFRQRIGDAAAGAEKLAALIGDDDLRRFAQRQMPLQRVGEVMNVDHGALDAGFGETVERIIDQRLAADLRPAASGSSPL